MNFTFLRKIKNSCLFILRFVLYDIGIRNDCILVQLMINIPY